MWFRDQKDESKAETRMEPYPQLCSVEQDEAIWWLKGRVAALDERIAEMEGRMKDLEARP